MTLGSELISLILIVGIGLFLLVAVLILPRRKAPYEKGLKPIHEERCSVKWLTESGMMAGGNMPVARLSFYSDFFVVAFIGISQIRYSGIKIVSAKKAFFSNSIEITTSDGRTLLLYPKSAEVILKLLKKK